MSFPINRTPAHLRCDFGASCPSVHEIEGDRLLIVGTLAAPLADLHGVSWEDGEEYPIVIDRSLLGDLIQAPAETDKPSGDHPGSEFEAKARDIMDEACLGEPFVRNGVDAALRRTIATALAEAVAAERQEAFDEGRAHERLHGQAALVRRSRGDVK